MPGPWFVRSGATGAGTGADWTNAFTTLAAAITASAAGDIFEVSEDHVENLGAATTYTFPGTQNNPNLVLCVNHTTGALASGAQWTTVGTFILTLAGSFYAYGCSVQAGSGSAGTASLVIGSSSSNWNRFENCKLALLTSGSSSVIQLGTTGGNPSRVELVNTTVQFGATGQSISVRSSRIEWYDTPSAIQGATLPSALFAFTGSTIGDVYCHGLDLSALTGTGKNLVSVNSTATASRIRFEKCRLGTTVGTVTGTIPGPGGPVIELVDCDNGTEIRHYELQCGNGSVVQSTSIVKTGGASLTSDGTQQYSWVMTGSSTRRVEPLETTEMYVMNEAVGAAKTVSVDVVYDAAGGALTASDLWLDIEGMADASDLRGVMAYGRPSPASGNYLGFLQGSAGAALTGSAANWNGTSGMTTPTAAKLSAAITPQMKGPIRARVALAANRTVYVDPNLQVA